MKKLIMIGGFALIWGGYARADELTPATTQDAAQFDKDVANAKSDVGVPVGKGKSSRRANFGAKVSAEAQKLSAENGDQKKTFGKWVSSQRAQGDQSRPTSSDGGAGGGSSASGGDSGGGGSNSPPPAAIGGLPNTGGWTYTPGNGGGTPGHGHNGNGQGH